MRNVSLKRQISTPCWLRKCSSSSFLPRNPSAFQQARRRSLARSVLGRPAIFGHKENGGLQDSPRAGCPCGQVGDGCEKPTSQLHTYMEGKVIEIRNFLEWEGGTLVLDHQVGGNGFRGRGFYTHGCFLPRLPSSQLSGCCGFGFRILRLGRRPGGSHFRLLGSRRDRLGGRNWNRG